MSAAGEVGDGGMFAGCLAEAAKAYIDALEEALQEKEMECAALRERLRA